MNQTRWDKELPWGEAWEAEVHDRMLAGYIQRYYEGVQLFRGGARCMGRGEHLRAWQSDSDEVFRQKHMRQNER